jgi:uncharacterized protein YndB with AHSA1/START domain
VARRFGSTATIDRPIEEVFAFLADGENDRKFSPRIIEIRKTTPGDVGVGTVYRSVARDGGVKAEHQFRITEFDPPRRLRWTELSKGAISVTTGGYDLEPAGAGTRLSFFNELEGRGVGKLIVPLALLMQIRGAPAFVKRIKAVIEGS